MKNKINRIVAFFLIAVIALITLTGCGNMSIGLGNYEFKHVHIFTHDGNDRCLEVEKWYEGDTGIEVCTAEYGSLFLSEGTYMLCGDKCPICDNEN